MMDEWMRLRMPGSHGWGGGYIDGHGWAGLVEGGGAVVVVVVGRGEASLDRVPVRVRVRMGAHFARA